MITDEAASGSADQTPDPGVSHRPSSSPGRSIILVSINFHPEFVSTGKYSTELAQYLSVHGWNVRVVTGPPYYPAWRVWSDFSWWRYSRDQVDGIPVYRCPLWVPRRPNGLTRILHTFSFGISVFPAVLWNLKWRSSWLLLVVPTMMAGPAALLGALFGRSNTWLHIQDFELDAAEALGILPRFGPLQRLLSAGERQIIRRFDTVSTICDSMVARLAEKGRDKKRTLILRNWVDTNEIRPLAEVSPLRRWLGIPDESVVVLYAGNMGKKQGLDLLLDCAGLLAGEKSLVFLLFGDGVERERLAQRAAGMGNVRMYPFEEPAHLNELLNAADIHVLPQRKDAEGAVLPSKLGGILASGRPVIATASAASDVGRIVSKTGLLVAPGDVEALAQGIQRLANDANLRRALGAAGREYAVDNLNKEVILGKMADLLESHQARGIVC